MLHVYQGIQHKTKGTRTNLPVTSDQYWRTIA